MPKFTIDKKENTTKGRPRNYFTTVKRFFSFFLYPYYVVRTESKKEVPAHSLITAHQKAISQLHFYKKYITVRSRELSEDRLTVVSVLEVRK